MNRNGKKRPSTSLSVVIGVVLGQVGILTLIIVIGALFIGQWLDNLLATRPVFTIGLMIASVPVTLLMMFWVVRQATARLQSREQPESNPKDGGDQQ